MVCAQEAQKMAHVMQRMSVRQRAGAVKGLVPVDMVSVAFVSDLVLFGSMEFLDWSIFVISNIGMWRTSFRKLHLL